MNLSPDQNWGTRVVDQPEATVFGIAMRPVQMTRAEELSAPPVWRRAALVHSDSSITSDHDDNLRFWNQPFWRIHDSLITGSGMMTGEQPLLPADKHDHSVDYINNAIAATIPVDWSAAADDEFHRLCSNGSFRQVKRDGNISVCCSAHQGTGDGPCGHRSSGAFVGDVSTDIILRAEMPEECSCTLCGISEDIGCSNLAIDGSLYCANCFVWGCNCTCDDYDPAASLTTSEPIGDDEGDDDSPDSKSESDAGDITAAHDLLNGDVIMCITASTRVAENSDSSAGRGDTTDDATTTQDQVLNLTDNQIVYDFGGSFYNVTAMQAYRAGKLYDWVAGVVTRAMQEQSGGRPNAAVVVSKKPSAQEHAALGLVKSIQDEQKWKDRLFVYEKNPFVFTVGAIVKACSKRSWSELLLLLIGVRYVLPAHANQLKSYIASLVDRLVRRVSAPIPLSLWNIVIRLLTSAGKFSLNFAKLLATGIPADPAVASSDAEVVAPIADNDWRGRISDKVVAAASLLPHGAALGDDGANIDCSK